MCICMVLSISHSACLLGHTGSMFQFSYNLFFIAWCIIIQVRISLPWGNSWGSAHPFNPSSSQPWLDVLLGSMQHVYASVLFPHIFYTYQEKVIKDLLSLYSNDFQWLFLSLFTIKIYTNVFETFSVLPSRTSIPRHQYIFWLFQRRQFHSYPRQKMLMNRWGHLFVVWLHRCCLRFNF